MTDETTASRAVTAFRLGARVLLQDRADPEDVVNVVARIDDNGPDGWRLTVLDPIDEAFAVGSPVRLSAPGEGALYVADSSIAGRAASTVDVLPPIELAWVQRRASRRIALDIPASWHAREARGLGHLVDLSRTGLRITPANDLRTGQRVTVDIARPDLTLHLPGLVVAVTERDGRRDAHVAFTSLDEQARVGIEVVIDAFTPTS